VGYVELYVSGNFFLLFLLFIKFIIIFFIIIGISDTCDVSLGTCSDQTASYTVGYVNQFGKTTTYGTNLSPWGSGVSGITNIGNNNY
jgi:uncharacterized SAM-binding protein YcdF (DUF218 family)